MKTAGGLFLAVFLAWQAIAPPPMAAQGKPVAAAPASRGAKSPDTTPWPDAAMLSQRHKEADNRRLFASDDVLPITLTADFKAVNRDRNPANTTLFPGALAFAKNDGSTLTVPVDLRTRGHVRRLPVVCAFAPLRLELPKEQVKGTVFDGQHGLKLGVHCRDAAIYEQYVLREYAVYKIYNAITPRSFRARLAKVTYVDADSKKLIATRFGLLFEDDDDVAKRLEGRISDEMKLPFGRLDRETLDTAMLFEYMIGNTDVSIAAQHNVRTIQVPTGAIFPVPYDFDYSGLVDTSYAIPAPALGIGSVRERLYRGACRSPLEWESTFARFRAAKNAIVAVYASIPGLNEHYQKDAIAYLDKFFAMLDKPGDVKKNLIDTCLKNGM